jgi:hypothetical protein
MKIENSIDEALRSDNPSQQLRSLVQRLFAQGQGTDSVLALFETARQQLREDGRKADEDALMDLMDCLVGWCGPGARLSPASAARQQTDTPTEPPPS